MYHFLSPGSIPYHPVIVHWHLRTCSILALANLSHYYVNIFGHPDYDVQHVQHSFVLPHTLFPTIFFVVAHFLRHVQTGDNRTLSCTVNEQISFLPIFQEPVTPTPTVVFRGKLLGADLVTAVWIDGREVCCCSGILTGFATMFSLFYVYGLEYPRLGKNSFIFIQQHLAGLDLEKPAPLKVQRFLYKIKWVLGWITLLKGII